MRRLLDVLSIGFVVGSIALQGAFLAAVGLPPGAAPALASRASTASPDAVAVQVCVATTGRKC